MTWLLWPLVGLAVLSLPAAGRGPQPVHVPSVRVEDRPAATELVEVAAQSSGTIARVLAAPREHVPAGTLLVELDSTGYREALTRARTAAGAAQGRVSTARSVLTVRERAVRAAVRAALATVPSLRVAAPPTRAGVQPSDDGIAVALEHARAQLVAAQADVVRAAEAKLATTQRAMERDQTLLAQGLISAREVRDDSAVYQSALDQAKSAAASLRRAQAAGPGNVGQGTRGQPVGPAVEEARHAVAAAQDNLQAAQAELAAARQTVDRDKALLTEGAIPAQQVSSDQLAYDAASARVAAAAASLQQAQVQLEAAHRAQQRNDAASHSAPVRRWDVLRAEGLVRQVQARILEAEQAARQVAAAEADLVNADTAIREAELDLDRSQIRAPIEGWVTTNMARPGEHVRSGQFLLLLSAPRQSAERLQQLRGTVLDSGANRQERLGRIAAEEHVALTRLDAESERIRTIILGAAGTEHIGPVPAFLGALLRRPVWGEITSGYGWRIHPIFQTPEFHTGIDIAAPWGTPVEAPADGTVIYAGQMPANGMLVILNHGNGVSTTYSHLSSYAVRAGERVHRGQTIARVGSSGWSTGPHLFFEVREGGRPVNPLAR
ncbi:MAG TPA: peptidoglycan DD-metalloendopeptidase family protein [bacterium]|nr:peptidoglycan DD-metalloendopeptidase family protein [bacterium]